MPTNASRAGERTRVRSHVSCPSIGSAVGCCSFPVPLAPQGCPLPLTVATGASNGANMRGAEERKVDGYWWPLGYRQVPGQCHAHPVPHGGGPRGLSLSLPQPGCPHRPHLFPTTRNRSYFIFSLGSSLHPKPGPSLGNAAFPHCHAEKADARAFSFSFKWKMMGQFGKERGCGDSARSWANPLNTLCWVYPTIKHPRTSQRYSENNCNLRFSRINCSNREERYDLLMISSAFSVFHRPWFSQERRRMPGLRSFSLPCKW